MPSARFGVAAAVVGGLALLSLAGWVAARVATAPPAGEGSLFERSAARLGAAAIPPEPVILVFGDSGAASPELDATLEAMAREPAALALHTGDIAYRGPLEYGRFLRAVGRLPFPVLAVPGDHDAGDAGTLEAYDRLVGGRDRAARAGGLCLLLLDSSRERIEAASLEWLRRELEAEGEAAAAGTARRIVVVTHVPPWQPNLRYPEGLGKGHALPDAAVARRFIDLLREAGVSLLACGHWHAFADDRRAGFPLLVSGGGGKDLEDGASFHYARVVLSDPVRIEPVVTAPPEGIDPFRKSLDKVLAYWLRFGGPFSALLAAAFAVLAFVRGRKSRRPGPAGTMGP